MYSYMFMIFLFIFVDNSYEYSVKSDDWNYIVFAQQWPPSVCSKRKPSQCVIPTDITSWTVHGIWPSGKHNPSFCNNSWTFNVTQIKSIENELIVVWPDLFPHEPIYTFWKHEWQKHGTCITSLPKIDSELKYFKMAIDLHHVFDIKKLLEKGGIVPDEHKIYDIEDIHKIVESQLGKKVGFECVKVKDKITLIYSSFICLDKSLTLIDCVNKNRNCEGKQVLYLPIERTKYSFSQLVFVKIPSYVGLSSVCYAVSGLVLVLTLIIIVVLVTSFKKNKAYKRMDIYNIPPPLTEEKMVKI